MKLISLSDSMFRIDDGADENCFTDFEIITYDKNQLTVKVSDHLNSLQAAATPAYDVFNIARLLLGAYESISIHFNVSTIGFYFNGKTYYLSIDDTPLSVLDRAKAVQ